MSVSARCELSNRRRLCADRAGRLLCATRVVCKVTPLGDCGIHFVDNPGCVLRADFELFRHFQHVFACRRPAFAEDGHRVLAARAGREAEIVRR